MTNEQLAAYLYQLACRLKCEFDILDDKLTPEQKETEILIPFNNIVFELERQVEMLTGNDCPTV